MALDVTCPHCSAQFETPDSFAGKMGKCPMCGEPFRAPSAPAPAAKAPPLKRAAALPESPVPAKPAAPPKAPPRRPEPASEVTEIVGGADDSPFSPIVTSGPSGSLPIQGTPSASKPVIKPPAPPASIPIWGWIAGGVVVVALLGGGVFALNHFSNTPAVATVPRKPGALDKEGGKGPALTADWGKPRTVKSLEDATSAMVKIVTPTKRGTKLGSGFIIDRRGWIATNHHVIEGANSNTRLVMSDGNSYELAPGVIVDVPELDMAIIKFKEPPFQLTIFELQPSPDPKLGSAIFCYGHPRGVDFSVVDGVVGRVVQTKDLDDGAQNFLYTTMRAAPDMVWIQHSAPIQPGNSGGPLIDKTTMKVIGVNTWVNPVVKFGYAGGARYLQTLLSTTKEELKPFPPMKEEGGFPSEEPEEEDPGLNPNPGGPGAGPPPAMALVLPVRDITAAKVTKQFEDCDKLKWQPTNNAGYKQFSELGKMLVTAKELSLNSGLLPAFPEEERKKVIEAGDEVFRKIAGLNWSGETPANLSRLAVAAVDQPGMGIVAVARRLPGQAGRPNIALFNLEGTPVLAEMPPEVASKVKEGRTLIIGMATPLGMRIQTPDQTLNIKVIRVNYAQSLGE